MDHEMKQAVVHYYSTVNRKEVEWLWYPYIPYGKVTLLQGDPGDGKSSLVLSLAAILSVGGILPDGSKVDRAVSILYQCPEDSPSDTIRPRLENAGADCSKIAFIEDESNSLSLDDKRIEVAIKKTGSRLVIFDPIQAFLQQDGEIQNANRMRTLMKLLGEIAERNHCAILLVGHMTKASGGKNLYRGIGSIDIAAAARSVLMVTRDDENPNIRYMFQVKSSLAPEAGAMSFYMHPQNGFQWIGKCNIDTKELKTKSVRKKSGKKEHCVFRICSKRYVDSIAAQVDLEMKQAVEFFGCKWEFGKAVIFELAQSR